MTWIYNEFYWATVLMQSGDKFPITSSLNNLRGQFFTDYNLLSAGSILVAIPSWSCSSCSRSSSWPA